MHLIFTSLITVKYFEIYYLEKPLENVYYLHWTRVKFNRVNLLIAVKIFRRDLRFLIHIYYSLKKVFGKFFFYSCRDSSNSFQLIFFSFWKLFKHWTNVARQSKAFIKFKGLRMKLKHKQKFMSQTWCAHDVWPWK